MLRWHTNLVKIALTGGYDVWLDAVQELGPRRRRRIILFYFKRGILCHAARHIHAIWR